MKLRVFYILFLIIFLADLSAQEKPARNLFNNMLWAGYYNTLEFTSKWSVVTDAQIRTNNWNESLAQGLIRSGLSCKLNERINVTTGFAYFNYFLKDSKSRSEHRPWQELGVNDKIGRIKIAHRYRLEERFNQKVKSDEPIDEYGFNFRIRYKLDLRYPIRKELEKGSNFYLIAGNELMVNCGHEVGANFFDQNRSSIGINYELNPKLGLQFQYLRIWQQSSSGQSISNINVLRFNLYHKIAL